ncbi:hypothetical protein RJT34_24131 [Clitoria ternatea]|uniref:Uncharacterized protein n=1 Tax=Clitoria ternatea TaxID=43366 RepID=A0AAN9FMD0_CLITE
MDLAAAPAPVPALLAELINMHVPEMIVEDPIVPVARSPTQMEIFIERCQWDRSLRFLRYIYGTFMYRGSERYFPKNLHNIYIYIYLYVCIYVLSALFLIIKKHTVSNPHIFSASFSEFWVQFFRVSGFQTQVFCERKHHIPKDSGFQITILCV